MQNGLKGFLNKKLFGKKKVAKKKLAKKPAQFGA